MRFIRLAAVCLTVLVVAGSAFAQKHILVNTANPQQVIEGWGTSLADWDSGARSLYRTQAFREAYRDLGLNIVRASMAKEVLVTSSRDFATPIPLGDNLQQNIAKMDFTIEQVKIYGETLQWLKQNALEPDRVKMSGSLWTPPHWMKGPTGFSTNFVGRTEDYPTPFLSNTVVPWQIQWPIESGASVGGRLKSEDPWTLDQYGKYIASWVAGFEAEYGVKMHVVSLQNESTFENPFDSMTFRYDENGQQDWSQYAIALSSVRDAWEEFGLDTKVMGPHVAGFVDNPSNPHRLWQQDAMIQGVKNHADPTLIDFLDFYNANFYNNTNEGNVKNIAGFWQGWQNVAPGEWGWHRPPGVMDDGKGMWYSETGDGGSGSWSGSNGQIQTALKIHTALVYGQASAYVYWQFADGGGLSQHNLVASNQLANPLSSKKYAAFKQYSRYIRPGAVRLDIGFAEAGGAPAIGGSSAFDPDSSLNISAFYHEEDGRITFVLLNMENNAEPIALQIPDLFDVPLLELFRTSASESFALRSDFTYANGILFYTAPAESVSTFTGIVVPEPISATLLLAVGACGLVRRRRRH